MSTPPKGLLLLNNDFDMEAMKIKFGGGNEIDANTLINSLIHFTNIVQEVNKELSNELNVGRKIEIKIKANEPGSFLVDLVIQASSIAGGIASLFSKEAISYAANVVQVVGGVYEIAKQLGGKKPKEVTHSDNSIHVTTTDGQVTVYDFTNASFKGATIYLTNPSVQGAITKEYETLSADPNVTSFELLDRNNNTIAEIDKVEFEGIAEEDEPLIELLPGDGRVITISQVLQIKAQDWTFKKAWDFYMNGHMIKAKINDQKFIEKVLNRQETFLAGDSLDVMLDIVQKLDKGANVWVNTGKYMVKEIKKHIKPSEQKPLFG